MRGATEREPEPEPEPEFQSTHPMRGATLITPHGSRIKPISIHAPHAGCDYSSSRTPVDGLISIHAPHAGCDLACAPEGPLLNQISIHAPHAGCDSERHQNPCQSSVPPAQYFDAAAFLPYPKAAKKASNTSFFRCEAPGESVCASGSHPKSSARPPARTSRGRRCAPPSTHNDFPARKTGGCPSFRRSARSARP